MPVRRDIKSEAQDAISKGIVDSEWEYYTGTTASDNLPQYKKPQHVGHCWSPCPFSTQSDDIRRENMIGTSTPSEGTNDHTYSGKVHYMKTHSKGAVWGFECTSDTCPYYTTHGKRYFYV